MRARLLLVVALSLVPGTLLAQTPPHAALVARLGSDQYAEREAATRQLEALGSQALDALRQAMREDDPELHRRARDLVRRIERRLESVKRTEPTRLRLSYRGENLAQVVSDLAHRAGMTIKLDPRARYKEITLETGEITFWEALDRICAVGDLVEVPPVASPQPQDQNIAVTSVMMIGRRATASATDILQRERNDRPPELVLTRGKPIVLPTYLAGAVRVQARPPGTDMPGQPRESGDQFLVLDVALEGKLHWHRGLGVRLDRVLDEKGQAVMLRPASYRPPLGSRSGVAVNGIPIDPEPDEPGAAGRLVPIRLRTGESGPARLSELAGSVVGQVWQPAEPLVTVPRILEAEGKSVRGSGGAVRVLEVEKGENGEVRLRVFVERAPRGLTAPQPLPITGRVVVNGRVIGDIQDLLTSAHFSLLDDKGRPFTVTRAMCTGRRDGVAYEYELTYEAGQGVGAASTFVYTDRRMIYLDIPFVLKDVPLK